MVKAAVQEKPKEAHARLKQKKSSTDGEHARTFLKRLAWVAEVMEDVEENEVSDLPISKTQLVDVFNSVDPWILKQVGGDALWEDGLYLSDARSYLYRDAGYGVCQLRCYSEVEISVYRMEQWLPLPSPAIGVNLLVVNLSLSTHTGGGNNELRSQLAPATMLHSQAPHNSCVVLSAVLGCPLNDPTSRFLGMERRKCDKRPM